MSSSREDPEGRIREAQIHERSAGPNLTLLYSLIALALVAAIAIALFIVFPFYVRR